jgi:hypothetical protein
MSTSRSKKRIFDTQKQDEQKQRILHIIWTCESFNFPVDLSLKYINSGVLGYKTNQNGTEKIDRNTGRKIPLTISRSTYFRYRKESQEISHIYNDLRDFVMKGYIKLLAGFQEELAYLHRLSAENLLATKNPLDRQHIIDSMVTKVVPTQSAFADILREMAEEKYMREYSEN